MNRRLAWREVAIAAIVCALSACGGVSGGAGSEVTAYDVTTARAYTGLVFEIDSVEDQGPGPEATDQLVSELEELRAGGHLGKPDGIRIAVDGTLPYPGEDDHSYSLEELVRLSEDHRSIDARSGELVVHVLYVDGHSENDAGAESVLGLAYGHDLIVVFRQSLDTQCAAVQPVLQGTVCALAESTVLLHETGHLMGLVNGGTPMVADHHDEANGAHDVDPDCIMHYLADSSSFVSLLADRSRSGRTPPSAFCDACLDDLAAVQ